MQEKEKGHCKHGEFDLMAGCPQCIADRTGAKTNDVATAFGIEERRATGITPAQDEMEAGLNAEGLTLAQGEPHIVKVQFYSETTGELSSRGYTYYSEDPLKVGDIVSVPVRGTTTKAKVSEIGVPESEIAAFKDSVKTIPAGAKMKPRAKPAPELEPAPELIGEQLAKEAGISETAPETALTLRPGADVEVMSYYNEAVKLQQYAMDRVIATVDDDNLANDDLIIIGRLMKSMDEKRKEYLAPLKSQTDAIRETYNCLMDPVLEADKITRAKMKVFKLDQQRKAQEAEELNRQAVEVARKQAAMNNGEFTTDITPVEVPPAPKLTRSDLGTAGLVANWTYRVIDLEKLPREYMIPDDAMLKSIAKQHHDKKPVAGVEFYNDPHIASRRR